MRTIFGLMLAIALLSALGTANAPIHAADFTVDSTVDAVDAAPGDGVCATAEGECTLRAAIQEANATPEPDLISVPAGTYGLTILGADEDAGATGDLDISAPLTITGAGADQTVFDANGIDRVVHLLVAGPDVTLSDLTIRGGVVPEQAEGGGVLVHSGSLTLDRVIVEGNRAGSDGGGIWTRGPLVTRGVVIAANASSGFGGGIFASADVTISDSRIENNTARGGAGIRVNDHVLRIERSAITGNVAEADGGGIRVFRNGVLHATNVTVSGNRVEQPGNGAGIRVDGTGNQLRHVTVANNLNGHGLAGFSADVTITDSIISGHAAGDCRPGGLTITAAGNNLDSDDSCGFNQTGDAGLAPLAYWGGPVGMLTHALGSVSPAIDAAASCGAAVDQRGEARPQGAACDLGAYEATPASTVETAYAGGFSSLGWVGGVVSVEEAFADVLDQLDGVWAWDATAQQFLTWRPSLPPALNTLKTLAPGTGLWIRLRDSGVASIPTLAAGDAFVTGDAFGAVVVPSDRLAPGGPCSAPERTFEPGFNLVTWSGGTAAPGDAFASLGGNLQGVWQWDNDADAYLTYNAALPEALNSLETIRPGESLWVRVATATVLTGPKAC